MWLKLDVYVSRDEFAKLYDLAAEYSACPNDSQMAKRIADILGLEVSDILYRTLNLIVKGDDAKSINEVSA